MEIKNYIKKITDYNKTNFEKGFTAITKIQDQIEVKGTEIVEKYNPLPEQGKKIIQLWADSVKVGRGLVKNITDKGYQEVENYFSVTK